MGTFFGTLFGLAIIAAAFGYYVIQGRDEARMSLAAARTRFSQVQAQLSDRKTQHDTLKKNYDLQRRIYDTNQALAEARAVMMELDDTILTQKQAYQRIVESRRNAARGSQLSSITLADGTEYQDVKILNFDDTSLSLLTAQGVMKARARDLPEHLKEYFRLDLIQPETYQTISTSSTASTSTASSSSGFQYTAPVMTSSDGYSNADQVKALSASIIDVERRISALERGKMAPLTGFDARLRSGSAAHRHRKKTRDDLLDREIAIWKSRRAIYMNQRKQLSSANITTR